MADKPLFRQLLEASTIGLNLCALQHLSGLLWGYGLDSSSILLLGFTIIFLVLGIIAGFRELIRMARKTYDGDDENNKKVI